MIVGIPGTGIGGIFYVLIAVLMPVRELFLKATKRSPGNRWGTIALALGLVGAIIAGIWAEVAVLNVFFLWLETIFHTDFGLAQAGLGAGLTAERTPIITFMAASAAFISLALLYGVVRILSYVYARRARLQAQGALTGVRPASLRHVRTVEPMTSMSAMASMSTAAQSARSAAARTTMATTGD